ncbi:MAG: bifunctional adenosylcobinamide kinase/adenosylcobinamide-phosphate guanylyltransferase [Synechococcales bacterium]|nr:bifunctional adenosylcobinamide kinase/adenosylcobinamide-phosphate guanylyltransferase [Synechococcales bacterium]
MVDPDGGSPAAKHLILVTGPARSGKSEWAEAAIARCAYPNRQIVYVATAPLLPDDADWTSRIRQHQQRRPADWLTLEGPVDLQQVILDALPHQCLLIDSLGTWLATQLDQGADLWEQTVKALIASLKQSPCPIVVVAEETGWGVIPAYPTGRLFRDRLGALTRHIGAIASSVYLVTGGYVLDLGKLGTPLPVPPAPEEF